VRLLFCGVRGSTPAPGAEFARVGGHTSCVALAHDGQPWTLLLDAGTGIRRVTAELGGRAFDGSIVLTHLHWDHVQGMPFFAGGDRDDARVRVFLPEQVADDGTVRDPVAVLSRAMSPPHFPIGPDGLRGAWTFSSMTAGAHTVEGFDVIAFDVPHKGGRTFGLRVSDGVASVAYIPDHLPAPATNAVIARECAGVDMLVHDAQFVDGERAVADLYGHATVDDALELAELAGVRRLALFHHSPARADEDVEAIGRQLADTAARRGVDVFVAREEDVIDLAATRR
jgi:phosphoribosyl 1,2-cyclic phosphodiesterase